MGYDESGLTTGDHVWARVGGYGWRAARVVGGTLECVNLEFVPTFDWKGSGSKKPPQVRWGRRHARLLVPRDPEKRGKDKPAADWKAGVA
jgi:hypothetical protein